MHRPPSTKSACFVVLSCLSALLPAVLSLAEPAGVLDLSDRRELFVDDYLLDRQQGTELRLHSATPREIVMLMDAPWEGSGCGFETVFRDGDLIRMYYIGANLTNADGTKLAGHPIYACYAESRDGIHWEKPSLGIVDCGGSKQNNIVLRVNDNFTPIKDPNPDCRPEERYKAVGVGKGGLWAWRSEDGIHWSPLVDKAIIAKGAFDTQNNAFWDPVRKHYWCYIRDFHKGIRDIRVATSPDFRTWTTPEMLEYPGSADEPLYTNQVRPYYRAPQVFLGFPTRYVERKWTDAMKALPDPEHRQRRMKFSPRYGTTVTDGMFMTSRDGRSFHRWDEAFLRPGPERRNNWVYGDCYQSLGFIETPAEDPTAAPELSFYAAEDHWKGPKRLRRYTIRIDGFASLNARKQGEFVTKPLAFRGKELSINFATSAAGSLRIELQDADSRPLPGFSIAESDELFGDTLDRVVTWKGRSDTSAVRGPIRIHGVMRDADLYSLQFRQ